MKDIKLDDIITKVKELHPNLPEKKIREIIIRGCNGMTGQIRKKKDIRIVSKKNGIQLTVYKAHSNKQAKE